MLTCCAPSLTVWKEKSLSMFDSGFTIFFWCTLTVAAFGILFLLLSLVKKWSTGVREGLGLLSALLGGVLVLLFLVGSFVFYPYDIRYVTWQHKDGVITDVRYAVEGSTSKDKDNGNGGLRIVLHDGTIGFTEDFRLATKRVGDRIEMICKAEWVSNNIDRNRCKAPTGTR